MIKDIYVLLKPIVKGIIYLWLLCYSIYFMSYIVQLLVSIFK